MRYGKDGIGTGWKPKKGEAVLMPGGNVYAPTSVMLMGGIYLPHGSYDYELLNATGAPDGTLYANADPSPQGGVLPTLGFYVSTTGELNANQHTDKPAPVLVTPDGDGALHVRPHLGSRRKVVELASRARGDSIRLVHADYSAILASGHGRRSHHAR